MSLRDVEDAISQAELQLLNITNLSNKYKGLSKIPTNKLEEEKQYLNELLTIAIANLTKTKKELNE